MNYVSDDKFKIIKYIKEFIIDIENILDNIPKKDFYNRDKIRDEITNVLYFTYIANNTKDIEIKNEYQIKVLSGLSMIDFYLERAYLLKYISKKQLFKYTSKLETLIKMTKGWISSD